MHIVCVCCHQLFMCIFCLFVYFVSFFGGSNLRKYYALVFFSAGDIHVQELSIAEKNYLLMYFIYIYKMYNMHCIRQFGRWMHKKCIHKYKKNPPILSENWTLHQGFFHRKISSYYYIIIYTYCNQKFATS